MELRRENDRFAVLAVVQRAVFVVEMSAEALDIGGCRDLRGERGDLRFDQRAGLEDLAGFDPGRLGDEGAAVGLER